MRRDYRWFGASRKALRAAEALGDEGAREELDAMSYRLFMSLLVVTLATVAISIMMFGMQACTEHDRINKETELIKVKAQADLQVKQQADAAALRAKYVERCFVTPIQAEELFPAGSALGTH